MERLRERDFAEGSLEAQASELLRAAQPYAPPGGLKRRVRERLLEGRAKRWAPLLLRPALVAGAVLCALSAAAAVGRAVLVHKASPRAAGAALLIPSERAPVAAHARPAAALEPALAPLDVAEQPAPAPAPADARRLPAEREHDARTADVNAQTEATLVYGAAKALRSGGDPVLAAKLLEDYAHRYPRGALAEEAMALSIDVSVARGDGRAKALATRYLSRYPHGHFQVKAERVLAQ